MPPNDGLTETQNVSLGDMSTVPMTVTLLGKERQLNRLKLCDYAIAEGHLRLQRGRAALAIFQASVGRALTLGEEVEIATQSAATPITMDTLCTEFDSRCQLIARGLVGNDGIPEGKALPWVLDNVDPSEHEAINELVNKITGAAVPLENSREEKSPDHSETSTPSDPNNGTAGSASSPVTSE